MISIPLLRAATLGVGLVFAAAALTACEEEGTAEKAGKKIDESAAKVGEALKDATK